MKQKFKEGDSVVVLSTYTHPDVTNDTKEYILSSDEDEYGYAYIIDDINDKHAIYAKHLSVKNNMSITNQFEQALNLIGKTVRMIDNKIQSVVVQNVSIAAKGSYDGASSVMNNLQNNTHCVVLHANEDSWHTPFVDVEIAPDHHVLKISRDYDAKIYKDRVEVGCQTIPIETVRKIIELHDKL